MAGPAPTPSHSRPARAGGRRPDPTWWPVLGVAAVLLFITFGGFVATAALSTPSGSPVEVAGAVRVSPLSGWEESGRSQSPPAVEITRGSANLDVYVFAPVSTEAAGLMSAFVSDVLEQGAQRLSVSGGTEEVRLRSGLAAVRTAYVGLFGKGSGPIEGELTAVVSPSGAGVVFDGWASAGQLDFALDDIHQMIGSAEVS